MIQDAELLITAAVVEVFSTMLNVKARSVPPVEGFLDRQPQIVSAVGFTGAATGVVYLYTTAQFARHITAGLLGLSPAEIQTDETDEMVNDTMGEIANMVVGQIKSRISDRGLRCVLTIPSIVRGSQLTIEPVSNTERHHCAFDCGQGPLLVEMLLKPNEV